MLSSPILPRACVSRTLAPPMLTEYEQRREARIARNREILVRLVGDLPAHWAMMKDPNESSPEKKKTGVKRKPRASIPEEDQRRSGRIRNLPAPIYTSFEVNEDLGDQLVRAARREARRKQIATDRSKGSVSGESAKPKPSKPPAPPAFGSIKTLEAKINECSLTHLGQPISDGTGALKAAVIHTLSPVSNPRFSKYSGIQEWKNCVCLFINVGDKHGNSYKNVFTHAGGRISWFAQPSQHEETPVIKRILETIEEKHDATQKSTAPAGLGEENGDEEDDLKHEGSDKKAKSEAKHKQCKSDTTKKEPRPEKEKKQPVWPVHLFARMEGFTYVYCGRLRVLEHFPHKTPMQFVFRLLDAPLLRHSDDFLGLVDLADADASLGEHKEKAAAASKKMLDRKEKQAVYL